MLAAEIQAPQHSRCSKCEDCVQNGPPLSTFVIVLRTKEKCLGQLSKELSMKNELRGSKSIISFEKCSPKTRKKRNIHAEIESFYRTFNIHVRRKKEEKSQKRHNIGHSRQKGTLRPYFRLTCSLDDTTFHRKRENIGHPHRNRTLIPHFRFT